MSEIKKIYFHLQNIAKLLKRLYHKLLRLLCSCFYRAASKVCETVWANRMLQPGTGLIKRAHINPHYRGHVYKALYNLHLPISDWRSFFMNSTQILLCLSFSILWTLAQATTLQTYCCQTHSSNISLHYHTCQNYAASFETFKCHDKNRILTDERICLVCDDAPYSFYKSVGISLKVIT